ncbi:MAG TPA: LacI family DNA-binding transcriptional regulator [Chloroflexota bacterium]|nr:LacI family DNA-binding transcriptional regulator [Chloroflexota bacterium]
MSAEPRAWRRTVTLRELARRLGVNPSTVSRVLNRRPTPHVSEATRARIFEVAAAAGYRPNRLARSLKLQRTHMIGMLIPDVTNPHFSALFRAVDDAASAAGYHVILCNTDDRSDRLQQHLAALGEGHVDGLIVACARRHEPALDVLRAWRLPYVLLNRRRDVADEVGVVPDDEQAARLAVAHLRALGHQRIAHVAGSSEVSRSVARLRGFRQAMAAAGVSAPPCVTVSRDLDEEAGAAAFAELWALPPAQRPTAVFAANDLVALGVLSAARRWGLRVPDDLSIVGSDDLPVGRYATPALTTVRLPVTAMGRLATELLIRQLEAGASAADSPRAIVVPVELVVRESSAPLLAGESSRDRPGAAPYPEPRHGNGERGDEPSE